MFRYTQFAADNRDLKAILYENWLIPRSYGFSEASEYDRSV